MGQSANSKGVWGTVNPARSQLDLAEFPRLRALVAGPDGDAVRAELHELLLRLHRPRATRHRLNMFVRVRHNGRDLADAAVVRNVSETGARIWFLRSEGLEVIPHHKIQIELRHSCDEPPELVEAELVRVVSSNATGMELAFMFHPSDGKERPTGSRYPLPF